VAERGHETRERETAAGADRDVLARVAAGGARPVPSVVELGDGVAQLVEPDDRRVLVVAARSRRKPRSAASVIT
jgi:hypothetical protein